MNFLRFKRIKNLLCIITALLILPVLFSACGGEKKEATVSGNISEVVLEPGDIYAVFDIEGYGEITFKLFPDIAPVAVERFAALAEGGYYDSKNIHRVVEDFIIQGGSLYGDGTDGEVQAGEGFKIETSEFARNFYGALCMAADSDEQNCYQFYIVSSRKAVDIDADILALEELLGNTEKELKPESKARYESYLSDMKSLSENVKELYKSKGGVFSLDGANTVFGQMLEGEDVLDAIAGAEVVSGNQIDDLSNIQSKPFNPIIINSVKIVRIPLPEPTTVTTEDTTKKSKKKTTAAATESGSELTDVVAFGETTTVPESDDEAETVSAEDETMPDGTEAEIIDTDGDTGSDEQAEAVLNEDTGETETSGESITEETGDTSESGNIEISE